MKTDIEIAQEAELFPITEVAKQLDMTMDDLELYGKYKAKISDEYMEKIKDNKAIGIFTKIRGMDKKETKTEFIIKDSYEIVTNKKILKEIEDGDKVHIKTFNYDEVSLDNKEESENQ